MNEVVQLLGLYAGILLLNVVLSALIYLRNRSPVNLSLLALWASSVAALIIQGAASGSELGIILGFASAFFPSLAMAELLGGVTSLPIPRRPLIWVVIGGAVLSCVLSIAGAPFAVAAAPTTIAVAAPIVHTAARVLATRRSELTVTGWALTLSTLAYSAHVADFPFIRNVPALAPVGFTLAILIGFALSITAPAVVLERATADRSRMEELNRLKSKFFANISHELRTPLTIILASLELLLGKANGEEREQLDVVRRNASRLLRLIDEMLDLSRLDAGGLRLNVAPVALNALVANSFETSSPLAALKSVEFVSSTGEREIGDLFGDAHRIESIIGNLIGNALKYTPDGGRIEIRTREMDDGAVVEVKDTGPGIPEPDLENVFERFYQVNRSDRRRQGGAGIGLALAKELAELHDGTLTVTSKVGSGSTFRLWLPKGRGHFRPEVVERRAVFEPNQNQRRRLDDLDLPARQEPAVSSAATSAPEEQAAVRLERRCRVLVVEDQPELRRFISQLLAPSFQVLEATDGQEGLEMVRREMPDLVLTDLMMPKMLGTDLCRALKSDPRLRNIPVLILTARIGSEATLEAYAHGADDFVPKPFHPQVLLARVRAQLQIRMLGLEVAAQEKLAAVGTLAAGIAHEVRNPVNVIVNAANVLLETPPSAEESRALLEVISDGARRIESVVSALYSHARPADSGNTFPCDVAEGLDATMRLLGHRLRDVSVHREYEDAIAWAPSGRVNQVLLNLIDNALRAGAKTIWLSAKQLDGRVVVRVRDDGCGIPNEIADRVFDPFFTTRAPGDGTGLGLHLSRTIADECGGRLLLVESRPGGTEFELSLPAPAPVASSAIQSAL